MHDATETGLPRAVAIAWGMQEVPQRGPNRGLSHERIVAAAMKIADAEGLGAVTMQAVAKSLGFTTMSLYRYVSSKDELLRLMQDAATRLAGNGELSSDWREALKTWAQMMRDAYRAHPWVLDIPRGRTSVLMPNSVCAADMGLRALSGLDLSEQDRIGLILVISQHVSGMVALERSLADEGEVAVSPEGVGLLSEVITQKRFPHLQPFLAGNNYVTDDLTEEDPTGMENEYSLGLDLIIAGLEQRLQRQAKQVD